MSSIFCADIVDAWIAGAIFKVRTCHLGFVQLGSVTLNGRPSIYFTFDFLTQPLAYLPPHDINLSSGLQRTQARDRKVNP